MNDALVLLFVAAIVGLRVWGEVAYRKVLERQLPSTQFEVLQAGGYLSCPGRSFGRPLNK